MAAAHSVYIEEMPLRPRPDQGLKDRLGSDTQLQAYCMCTVHDSYLCLPVHLRSAQLRIQC